MLDDRWGTEFENVLPHALPQPFDRSAPFHLTPLSPCLSLAILAGTLVVVIFPRVLSCCRSACASDFVHGHARRPRRGDCLEGGLLLGVVGSVVVAVGGFASVSCGGLPVLPARAWSHVPAYPGTRPCPGFCVALRLRVVSGLVRDPFVGTWLLPKGWHVVIPVLHAGWCGTPLGHLAIACTPLVHTSLRDPRTRPCSIGLELYSGCVSSLGWCGTPVGHLAIA